MTVTRYVLWVGVGLAACGGSNKSGDAGPTIDVGPPPAIDPIEPVWPPNEVAARVKSPGQRMHYTEGLPFRILADAQDPLAYECPPGSPPYVCPDSNMQFSIDGAGVGMVNPDPDDMNLWELRLPNGLPAGDHVITVRFKPHKEAAVDGFVPIYIKVDPMPGKTVMSLNADLVLSGGNLDWTNVVVKGNGHKVTGSAGKITIKDSLVTGLAGFDNKIGIDVTASGGVEITNSIFEATAPLKLNVGGGAITITGNEFRSTNFVTYVSNDPNKSPILEISGGTSGAKTMQGNRFGAGIVLLTNQSGWQIGGLKDTESNIFVGPRCVLQLESSSNAKIQGNYFHHDYLGGFSQGFNVQFGGSANGATAEHNLIRDGSWPLQNFGGEFRYNVIVNSGHDFIRSAQAGAKFHHNIFTHAQAPNSGFDGAMFLYDGEQNVVFDNNTIDGGGSVGDYDAPAITLANSNVSLASLRNNAFTQFSNNSWPTKSLVAGSRTENTVGARITKADYNAFHNPLAGNTTHYMPGIVSGTAGAHDVSSDVMFNGEVPQSPYQIDEGLVWQGDYGVSQVLGYYRGLYTPRTGSPLIDSGDPADGSGNDIGAIGAGTANANDKFGLVMTRD